MDDSATATHSSVCCHIELSTFGVLLVVAVVVLTPFLFIYLFYLTSSYDMKRSNGGKRGKENTRASGVRRPILHPNRH